MTERPVPRWAKIHGATFAQAAAIRDGQPMPPAPWCDDDRPWPQIEAETEVQRIVRWLTSKYMPPTVWTWNRQLADRLLAREHWLRVYDPEPVPRSHRPRAVLSAHQEANMAAKKTARKGARKSTRGTTAKKTITTKRANKVSGRGTAKKRAAGKRGAAKAGRTTGAAKKTGRTAKKRAGTTARKSAGRGGRRVKVATDPVE